MSSMQVESISTLIEKSDDTQLVQFLEKLNSSLLEEDPRPYEKELHSVVISRLENNNKDVQIAALDTLLSCIKRELFTGSDCVDIAYLVVNIIKINETDNVEQQEIFIKATTCLQEMVHFHVTLYKTRPTDMLYILKKIINSSVGSVNKIHALKMLEIFIKNTDSINEPVFLTIWIEDVCPIMFNIQTNLLTPVLEYSNKMLPILQRLFQQDLQLYNNFVSTVEHTYIPIIASLVSKEQTVFAQLWIYLCRLLSIKFHIGFQLVNMMLAVVETAFKSQNTDIRHAAFNCWQVLITEFLNNSDLSFTDKRVKLLSLPLKANNGRTEKIAQVKFETWCKLLSALVERNVNVTNFMILDNFLQFCFGPLHEQTLLSWMSHGSNTTSHGKRFPNLFLNNCKAFLQLFGMKKYIDETLILNHFDFKGPILNLQNCGQPKHLINAVGECSLLLSVLEKGDRVEINLIVYAVWKTLFDCIDNLEEEELKQNCIQHVCSLIVTIAGVARKKTQLVNYSLVPIFSIITSGDFEFFKQNKTVDILFLPFIQTVMKKDKILLQKDIVPIFKKIFTFKRQHPDFLKFVQSVLSRFSLGIKENLNDEKLEILENIWLLLLEDLKVYLHNILTPIDDNLCSVFSEFLLWPVLVLNQNFSHEILATKWKELFYIFGVATSMKLRHNLIIRMLKTCENKPQFLAGASRIICYILHQINTTSSTSEEEELVEIFALIKKFVFTDNLNSEIVDIFTQAFQKIISSSSVYPYFLENYILDNILHLIFHYNKTKLLDEIISTTKLYTNRPEYSEKFDNLFKILSEKNDQSSIEKIKIILEKEEIKDDKIILLGHNVETMKPVTRNSPKKSESPEEIFVNTPYKFDPKKLTKSQKEKLAKRKDDIPALYEDLTQSTQELSNSNSNLESSIPEKRRKRKEKENQNRRKSDDLEQSEIVKKRRGRSKKGNTSLDGKDLDSDSSESSKKTRKIFPKSEESDTEKPKRRSLKRSEPESDPECVKPAPKKHFVPVKSRRLSLGNREEPKTPPENEIQFKPRRFSTSREEPEKIEHVFKIPDAKADVQTIMEENLSDYENLDEKVKTRVSRELLRIKMDIKNTGEFYKHKKRKTRTSFNLLQEESSGDDEKVEKKKSPVDRRRRRTQSLDVVEPTPDTSIKVKEVPKAGKILKQVKLPVLYPLDSVKPGERLYISSGPTTTDVIKGPEPSSPFRILSNVQISPPRSATCKSLSFQNTNKQISPSTPKIIIHSNELITPSQSQSQSQTETLDIATPQETDFSCRKVLFEDTETEEKSPEIDQSLPGSPVNVETPTRNKELLKNTLDISPIKNPDPDRPPSPEISIPDRVGNNSPHPDKAFLRKKGRGAQMMDMVAVKPILSPKKRKLKEKAETYIPPQNRTMKMMENIGNVPENAPTVSDEIKDEDILIFQRALPSPYASPGLGILKKRKLEEEADMNGCKRRRVNFHDPPVSSRKYIEINAKNRLNAATLKPERITRSKTDLFGEVDPVCTLFPTEIAENEEENVENEVENVANEVENVEYEVENAGNEENMENDEENTPEIIEQPTVENTEKFNEVSVIKNSESLFSESLPEPEVIDETEFPPGLEENVEKIMQLASEKPEIQNYLVEKIMQLASEKPEIQNCMVEKLLSVVPLENVVDAALREYSFEKVVETTVQRNINQRNKEYF